MKYAYILAGKTPPPKGEQISLRCDLVGEEMYLRVRGKGWFYYIDREWRPCPMGPPFAHYPQDFVDDPTIDDSDSEE